MNQILTRLLPIGMMIGFLLLQGGCSLIGLNLQSQPASPDAPTPAQAEPAQVGNYRQNLNNAIQNGQESQQKAIDQVEKQ